MVYGETGRYPLYIDSKIASLTYWLKLDTENRCKRINWAGSIKECLESYGFQDVWAQGGVSNEAAFLSAIRQKIIQRFKLEWSTKISNSDRFATYLLFKSVHQAEKYLNDITIKKFRDTLIRLRLGIDELGVNKRFQPENAIKTCPFCPGVLEDEIHFLFICPVYAVVRHKYLREFTDNDVEPSLNSVFENPSIDANRKVEMFAFYALKHREEMLAS